MVRKLKLKEGKMMNKKVIKFLTTVMAVLGLTFFCGSYSQIQANSAISSSSHKYVNFVGDESGRIVSEQLADSVLTQDVRQQLGNNIVWNGHGAFIINDNQTNLNADVNVAPYATNQVDKLGRPTVGNAFLNKTCRQYKSRDQLGEGWTPWKPQGFHQLVNLKDGYTHAYDRGHLLGYALVGGIKGFNASESNPRNIATQTAWANEADTSDATGQNYYEGIVRKGIDQGKEIRYRVTDVYDGNDLVPSGAHIEAKSTDGSIEFNVFVPNVQPNIRINYATGVAQTYYWQESNNQISSTSKPVNLVNHSFSALIGSTNKSQNSVSQESTFSTQSKISTLKENQDSIIVKNNSSIMVEKSLHEQTQLKNSESVDSSIKLTSSDLNRNNGQDDTLVNKVNQNNSTKVISQESSSNINENRNLIKEISRKSSVYQVLNNHKNESKGIIPQTGDDGSVKIVLIGLMILSVVGILELGYKQQNK